MFDEDYYEGVNVNDQYETRGQILELIKEFKYFDSSIKRLFGPKKVKTAAKDARRSIRTMKKMMDRIAKTIQMTKEDYHSDYY